MYYKDTEDGEEGFEAISGFPLSRRSPISLKYKATKRIMIASLKMTLLEFIEYDDGSDTLYELESGELIPMPAESELNRRIATFIFAYFLQLGIPYYRLTMKTEIATSGARVSVTIPDLLILYEALAKALEGASRSLILMDMPPPELVVEVVSPQQATRDYRYKRSEYAARGIAEYWIIAPGAQRVTVLEWVEGLYEEKVYSGNARIVSPLLGNLELTAEELLRAG